MIKKTWLEVVINAFENLGGSAVYDDLYLEVEKIKKEIGDILTKEWKASVRGVIERHSSDSKAFKKKEDIFERIDNGYWGLRNRNGNIYYNKNIDDYNDLYVEGIIKEKLISTRYRNKNLILDRKKNDNFTCQACGFHYYNNKIVECHHLKPLSKSGEIYNSIEDLITLCPNCHSLAHCIISLDNKFQKIEYLLPELRKIYKEIYKS